MKKTIENFVVGLLIVILVAQVLSILPIGVKAQGEEFQASYSTGVPVIDGMLGQEWNDANSYAINLSGISWITPGPWDPAWVLATVYFKHDGTNIYLGLKVFADDNGIEFAVYFDEGNDSAHGSGTRDGVLTGGQEDAKSVWSDNTLKDGCYKNGSWYGYYGGDFAAACVFVVEYWEVEFSIPFVGNDGGTPDVSDLVCGITDTVGIKIQYFTQPGAINYFYPADWQSEIRTYTTLGFEPSLPQGLTVESIVDTASPLTEGWSYSIYADGTQVVPDFTLDANYGGAVTFDSAPFIAGDIFTVTATPKYGYTTDISSQTDGVSSVEIDGLQAVVTLVPNGAAWVTFTNTEEPQFSTAPIGSPPPGQMTYSVPPLTIVPVQAAWNPDKNGDGFIDLVAGKPTVVLVNLAGVIPGPNGVEVRLTFTGPGVPSPITKIVNDLDANSIVSFGPITLSSAGTVEISGYYNAGAGQVNLGGIFSGQPQPGSPTTVTVRNTNDLSVYYGYNGNFVPSNYNTMVSNSKDFMQAVYPVKNVVANTAFNKIRGQNTMAKDASFVADTALKAKYGVGIEVVKTGYFTGDYADYVGISYGENCKGVIVQEDYWTSPAHEVGHTFGLYCKPTPEEYDIYKPWGQPTSGVSAVTGYWRQGQDFMGAAPYMSLDNTWVNNAITYNAIFNKMTATLNDPGIVIVSGIFHKGDGSLELPLEWSRLLGTPSEIVSGDYALKFVNANGDVLDTVMFDAQYSMQASVGVTVGKNQPSLPEIIETDEAPFCFAVALPEEPISEIQIWDTTPTPGHPDGNKEGTVPASEIVDLGVTTDAYITDADYNPIDSFECVFTPDKGTGYKMSATNPGTFYYNLKITNNDPTAQTFTIAVNIPSDFVLKPLSPGANPVQINGQPVAYSHAPDGTLTVPNILIGEGQTKTLRVHLDYGLKFKYGAPQLYTQNSQTTFAKGYAFRATVNSFQADAATIAAVGKKVTAIGGFLTDVNGVPKGGLTVEVTSNGNQVGTNDATSDGFYFIAVPPGGPYKVGITNSLDTPVGPVDVISIAKDQFVEKDFNTLSPADPVITGFVTDTSGNGVAGVTVQLLQCTGKVLATTATNLGGYYVFRFSQPGQYTVKITVPSGYTATAPSTTLSVKQFETAQVNFSLATKR